MHTILSLSAEVYEAMFAEARACFPREACGVIVGPQDRPAGQRFVRFDNLADALHEADPEAYPRDARTAFALHPLKLQRLVDEVEAGGGGLVAIMHSHPQHPSYFSKTDRAAASPFSHPTWPDATQIVVSVFEGEIAEVKGFFYEEDWSERPLGGAPELPGPPPGAAPLGEV